MHYQLQIHVLYLNQMNNDVRKPIWDTSSCWDTENSCHFGWLKQTLLRWSQDPLSLCVFMYETNAVDYSIDNKLKLGSFDALNVRAFHTKDKGLWLCYCKISLLSLFGVFLFLFVPPIAMKSKRSQTKKERTLMYISGIIKIS